jgi:ABC-type glutathione transport system ATPase component
VKLEEISKKYKKKLAVDDLSFTVEPGKVTGFLGPNGAGKSTTMRLMLGLDRGEGKTLFNGKPLYKHDHPAQIVGVLLEAKAFHPTRSARSHLRRSGPLSNRFGVCCRYHSRTRSGRCARSLRIRASYRLILERFLRVIGFVRGRSSDSIALRTDSSAASTRSQ